MKRRTLRDVTAGEAARKMPVYVLPRRDNVKPQQRYCKPSQCCNNRGFPLHIEGMIKPKCMPMECYNENRTPTAYSAHLSTS